MGSIAENSLCNLVILLLCFPIMYSHGYMMMLQTVDHAFHYPWQFWAIFLTLSQKTSIIVKFCFYIH